jgi:hypothetical protein
VGRQAEVAASKNVVDVVRGEKEKRREGIGDGPDAEWRMEN